MSKNIFELATRKRYRFPFKGNIGVEDLWDLNLSSLDVVFKTLNNKLKQVKEDSLLEVRSAQDTEIENKVEIVKYIFKVKSEEQEAILKQREKAEQKQKILEALNEKKDEALKGKSVEELQSMLEDM